MNGMWAYSSTRRPAATAGGSDCWPPAAVGTVQRPVPACLLLLEMVACMIKPARSRWRVSTSLTLDLAACQLVGQDTSRKGGEAATCAPQRRRTATAAAQLAIHRNPAGKPIETRAHRLQKVGPHLQLGQQGALLNAKLFRWGPAGAFCLLESDAALV